MPKVLIHLQIIISIIVLSTHSDKKKNEEIMSSPYYFNEDPWNDCVPWPRQIRTGGCRYSTINSEKKMECSATD